MLTWLDWCRRFHLVPPRPGREAKAASYDHGGGGRVPVLDDDDPFPPPEQARPDGLLAAGGSLAPDRLIRAYTDGTFPWYEAGGPVLWWSPDPRLVLDPSAMHVSRSLRAVVRKATYTTTFDRSFRDVVTACATVRRPDDSGTWITPEIEAGYAALHDRGVAHSVEVWRDGALAGGLYGVLLGRCFFGESMFSRRTNASKVALVALTGELRRRGVDLIDCQVVSAHLMSLGAVPVPRAEFLRRLREGLADPVPPGCWTDQRGRS